MVIYIDLLFILNFIYDFFILETINVTLKRYQSLKRILFGSLFGSLTIFLLFLKINYLLIFIFKIISGLIMIILTFNYRSFKYTLNNLLYLYMTSVILAGFLYYLNTEFKNANYLLLLFIAPLILGLFIIQNKDLKAKKSFLYLVKIVLLDNKEYFLKGYIDTGNRARDPITHKYVIITNKKIYHNKNPIYVGINTIKEHTIIKCYPIKYLEIKGQTFNNYLIGYMDKIPLMEDCDCLLNYKLLEDIK